MTSTTWFTTLTSPAGELLLTSDGHGLTGLYPASHRARPTPGPGWARDEARFSDVRAQLVDYFEGRRMRFDLPLAPAGTPFQQRVWTALQAIPAGATQTYGALAAALGAPRAARAVGLATGKNPVSLIIPCHRLVGAGGALTGYAGGLALKRWLLAHEGASHRPQRQGATSAAA
jgi:methylated-DNA-[protein]-cysteine S-methyltransferase